MIESQTIYQMQIDAINAWKIAVNHGCVQPIAAYDPIQHGPGTPNTFGAVNAARNLFTIGLDKELCRTR